MKRNSFFGMLSAVAVVFTSCNDFDGAQIEVYEPQQFLDMLVQK